MSKKMVEMAITDLSQAIGLLVRRARAVAASHELSWAESGVLKRLARDGPATTADLARGHAMRPQSMRTVVAALENRGLVHRKPHATDGRQVNLQLTAKGAAKQKSMSDVKRAWLFQAIGHLSEREQTTLFAAGQIMKRIATDDRRL